MRILIASLVSTFVLLAPLSAFAQDTGGEQSQSDPHAAKQKGFLLGAKVGGIAPFNGLSPNARVGVELGYFFPVATGSLGFAADVDFAAPKSHGTKTGDPRVPGGTYDWHLTEQQLAFMPVVMYRFTVLKPVVPYAGIGPRINFLRSSVKGSSGGMTIDETTEQSTAVGVGIPLGAELKLGPGSLLAELLFEYSKLNHVATGKTSTVGLSLSLGYRVLL